MGLLDARIALENAVTALNKEITDTQNKIKDLINSPDYLGLQRRIRVLGNAGKLGVAAWSGNGNYYPWADANDQIWYGPDSDKAYKTNKPIWDNWQTMLGNYSNRINQITNVDLPAAQKALDNYIKNNPNDPAYAAYIEEQKANAAQAQKDAEIQKANYAAGNTKNILIAVVIIVIAVAAFAMFKPTKSAA